MRLSLVMLALSLLPGCPYAGWGIRVYFAEDWEGCAGPGLCEWNVLEGRASLVSTVHAAQIGLSFDEDGSTIQRRFDGGLLVDIDEGVLDLTLISSCIRDGLPTLRVQAEVEWLSGPDDGPEAQTSRQALQLPVHCPELDVEQGRYRECKASFAGAGLPADASPTTMTIRSLTLGVDRGARCAIDRLRIERSFRYW